MIFFSLRLFDVHHGVPTGLLEYSMTSRLHYHWLQYWLKLPESELMKRALGTVAQITWSSTILR